MTPTKSQRAILERLAAREKLYCMPSSRSHDAYCFWEADWRPRMDTIEKLWQLGLVEWIDEHHNCLRISARGRAALEEKT